MHNGKVFTQETKLSLLIKIAQILSPPIFLLLSNQVLTNIAWHQVIFLLQEIELWLLLNVHSTKDLNCISVESTWTKLRPTIVSVKLTDLNYLIFSQIVLHVLTCTRQNISQLILEAIYNSDLMLFSWKMSLILRVVLPPDHPALDSHGIKSWCQLKYWQCR